MKFSVSSKLTKTDCLAICMFEKTELSKQFSDLPKNISELIQKRIKAKDFEGKADTSITLYPESTFEKVIVFGLGEKQKKGSDECADILRTVGASARQKTEKSKSISIMLPKGMDDDENFEEFAEGFMLGGYKFEKYLSKKADKCLIATITLIGADKKVLKKIKEAESIVEAVFWARDVINIPGSDMSPNQVEKEAKTIGKLKNISVKVLDHKKLEKMKAGAILAVGQGATEKARMIVFEYKNKPRNKKPMAFIGKGVCFDTGGLNLKPTKYIEDMKLDMSGAATVMGIFKMLGELQPNLHVVGVVGVVENAISEKAYKPGDIIKALNGKTIEILNTDAEGRLVLADCLTYIEKEYKPAHMMDFATLTGAALYTTGHDITPILGTDQEYINKVLEMGKRTDEIMWQLPLYKQYAKAMKGTISDLNNTGDGVRCGTITATLFLQNFINNGTPWIHCDMAGTAHGDSAQSSYKPKGGRGVLLRALWEFLREYK
ncbi:MAG: leucyl aminopeptidase family protein [Candidatus Peregrinibacteria bacterium]|nr:leucyl aminopeptidase family protein [Candidatus Peregrinibacteria bacterium]MDZ4244506.1 leucyl aminopeptidase family protein [Candidatus Gracilibacteria bacterium]